MAAASAKTKRPLRDGVRGEYIGRVDDESQQLIAPKSKARTAGNGSRKHVRPRKVALSKQSHIQQGQSNQHLDPTFDQHVSTDLQFIPPESRTQHSAKKKKGNFKMLKKAGHRLEWMLKKSAKYFGLAIIKIFDTPTPVYTPESRICVA